MSRGLVDRLGRRPIPFRKSIPSRLALTEGAKLEALLSLLAGEPTGLIVGSGSDRWEWEPLVMPEEESMGDSETPTALVLTDPQVFISSHYYFPTDNG